MVTKPYFCPEILEGQHICKLIGREMALDDFGPEWTHPAVPCLQLDALFFCLNNDRAVKLYGFHNDDGAEFALEECEWPELYQGEPEDIFRTRVLEEFVGGPFLSIRSEGETGVESWHIQVGQSEIVLVAAEVEAREDGYLFRRPDESILLFAPPERLHLVEWNQHRTPSETVRPGFAPFKVEIQPQDLERGMGSWPSSRVSS